MEFRDRMYFRGYPDSLLLVDEEQTWERVTWFTQGGSKEWQRGWYSEYISIPWPTLGQSQERVPSLLGSILSLGPAQELCKQGSALA